MTLAGAPTGTTAELTGPANYSATVTSGQMLSELVPGTYTLTGVSGVKAGSVVDTVLDAPAPLQVTVTGGAQAQPTLTWTARGGTGSLWVGSTLTQVLGMPDGTLGNPLASCTTHADCSAGTTCAAGNFCARSAAVGTGSHLAVVALADGTLVFGGGASGTPRLTTYAPAALASASPQPSQVLAAGPAQGLQVTWPGTAPTEFSALAAMPDGTVFAAAGDKVLQLPRPLAAGQAQVALSGIGTVLALAVTSDSTAPGNEVLWAAFRIIDPNNPPQLVTVVKGYTVGSGGIAEVADLAMDSSAAVQDAFGAQVALGVSPDGQTLWMADGLPGAPSQVRLQAFTLSGVPNATVEASRTLFVSGFAAPMGLAVGNLVDAEQASPLLLADDADVLLQLSAREVSQLSNEGTFGTLATVKQWSVASPAGVCFSPPRP